ncbi:MAG: transglycosylase SLT domain-containing protein [Desulfobacterales bacterium]
MKRYDRCRTAPAVLFWILCLLPALPAAAQQQRIGAEIPDLAAALSEISHADFCGEPVPFDNPDVRERFEKEMLLSLWNRPQVLLWLKRSDRYLGVIETILAEQGMPGDLKYIAVIESALRPHAGSRKGAIGFWQFLADTARRYGLTVDARRDERRNIFDSTRAAAAYFSELHQRFGSWTMAAAAYNLGEERLAAEIAEQGVDRYYDLYLPLETQRYVLQVVSAKLILEAPERYGFFLPPENRWRPLSFDQVRVECQQETPLRLVAAAAGTTFKRIKDLNPEIRGHSLGPGAVDIRVPSPSPASFAQRFESLQAEYLADSQRRLYVVREGDNLSLIADRFGVSLSSLLIWNRIDPTRTIHPGDRLFVYPEVAETEDATAAEAVTVE